MLLNRHWIRWMSLSLVFIFELGMGSRGFAADRTMLERAAHEVGAINKSLKQIIRSRRAELPIDLFRDLETLSDRLYYAENDIWNGLNRGQRPPQRTPLSYKYVARSLQSPGVVGRGWTPLEARAYAAAECVTNKSPTLCDDDRDFEIEEVAEAYPEQPLDYSHVCLSLHSPGSFGVGYTGLEARAYAGQACSQKKALNLCDESKDFLCDQVSTDFIIGMAPYRFSSLNIHTPKGLGFGYTRAEAIAEAAKQCRTTQPLSFCDDDSEFEIDTVGTVGKR